MATVQERPTTTSKNGSGTLRINHLLEDGDYVTLQEYTPEQQEEIIVMLQEAARAGARAVQPDLDLFVNVRRVDEGEAA